MTHHMPDDSACRILLVDDHPLLRKGLIQLLALSDGMQVVGEAADGDTALQRATELDPDLIVLDLNMQGRDGLDTLRCLREQGCTARIVMLTVSDNSNDVLNCLRAGADGYLLKDMEPEMLLEKLHQAAHGTLVASPALVHLLAEVDNSTPMIGVDALTERELQIADCLAAGLSNKLIARQLDISEGTVKVHVKHLLKKMAMHSRMEVAVWAFACGRTR